MSECYCDDGEYPVVYEETDVRSARIEHACTGCRHAILPGESYRKVYGIWPTVDGPATFRICARCMALQEWATAHIPCLCLMLGNWLEEIEYAVSDGEAQALRPEFDAMLAEIRAQPSLPHSSSVISK